MPRYRDHTTNDEGQPLGLVCSDCGCQHFLVDRVEHLPNQAIKRVRHCRHCGKRKVTIEKTPGSDAIDRI